MVAIKNLSLVALFPIIWKWNLLKRESAHLHLLLINNGYPYVSSSDKIHFWGDTQLWFFEFFVLHLFLLCGNKSLFWENIALKTRRPCSAAIL